MATSLEDDILNQEFPGKATNIMDAEVIYQRPKASRPILPIILVGVLVVTITLGGLFFDEIKTLVMGKVSPTIKYNKPAIESAQLPEEINAEMPKTAEPAVPTNEPAAITTPNLQPSVTDDKEYKVPGATDIKPSATTIAVLSNEVVKPDFTPVTKTSGSEIKLITPAAANNPVKPIEIADKERYDALDVKIRDLTLLIAELSKKVDAVALEKKENAPKALPVAKPSISEKKKASNLTEITRSMKDLHIVALLSDGVMFEGDIAVSIGQYAKHLNGKIINVNTEQNTITTDSKIFKVL